MTTSDFNFNVKITRAFTNEVGKMFIEGIASSTSIDAYTTIFSEKCQQNWINDLENGLPTYIEVNHDGEDWTKRIGRVTRAFTIPNPNKDGITDFYIIAELDERNHDAVLVYNTINEPRTEYGQPNELGLSIRGKIIEARKEKINGKIVTIFDRARLLMVGVVEFPANPDTFVTAMIRSLNNNKKDNEKMNIEEKREDESDDNEEITIQIPIESPPPRMEEPSKEEVLKNDTLKEIREYINEMILAINAVESSALKPINVLEAVLLFIGKYSSIMKYDCLSNAMYKMSERSVSKLLETLKDEVKRNDELINSKLTIDNNIKEKDEISMPDEVVENKVEEVKVEETKDVEEPKVEEQRAVETKEITVTTDLNSEILSSLRDLTASLKSLKDENTELRAKVEEMGKKPITTPANQVFTQITSENKLSGNDIMRLYQENRLNPDTKEKVSRFILSRFYGKS